MIPLRIESGRMELFFLPVGSLRGDVRPLNGSRKVCVMEKSEEVDRKTFARREVLKWALLGVIVPSPGLANVRVADVDSAAEVETTSGLKVRGDEAFW